MGIKQTTPLLVVAGLYGYAAEFRRTVGHHTGGDGGSRPLVRGCVYLRQSAAQPTEDIGLGDGRIFGLS